MPTYEYVCENCGYKFEQLQSITAKPLCKCPKCDRRELKRLIGIGAGIIFKGSGFYQTDYRSEGYKKAVESEKTSTEKKKTDDSKPSGKTESDTKDKKKSA